MTDGFCPGCGHPLVMDTLTWLDDWTGYTCGNGKCRYFHAMVIPGVSPEDGKVDEAAYQKEKGRN